MRLYCGAISALLAWYGLLNNDKDLAIRLLDLFWKENAVNSLYDVFLNEWLVNVYRFPGGVAVLQPYLHPGKSAWAQDYLKDILEKLIDFRRIKELLSPSSPDLLIGAVDINSGLFKSFKNAEISADEVLASVALPILYMSVHINGRGYWDGAFSQTRSIRDLVC